MKLPAPLVTITSSGTSSRSPRTTSSRRPSVCCQATWPARAPAAHSPQIGRGGTLPSAIRNGSGSAAIASVGRKRSAELTWLGVHVHQRGGRFSRTEQGEPVGRRVVEAVTDGEDQVGRPHGSDHAGVGAEAEGAGERVEAMVDEILSAEPGDERDARQCPGQRVDGGVAPAAAAHDREWPVGSGEQRPHVGCGALVDRGPHGRHRGADDGIDLSLQQVLRQPDHHRPRSSRAGRRPRRRDHVCGACGVDEFVHPFAHRPEHPAEVDLLECVAPLEPHRELTDEHDHRRLVLLGRVDAGGGVEHAGPAAHHQHSRRPRELRVGLGGEGGAALLSARHERERRRVDECVEHGEEALARNAEGALAPARDEFGPRRRGRRWASRHDRRARRRCRAHRSGVRNGAVVAARSPKDGRDCDTVVRCARGDSAVGERGSTWVARVSRDRIGRRRCRVEVVTSRVPSLGTSPSPVRRH